MGFRTHVLQQFRRIQAGLRISLRWLSSLSLYMADTPERQHGIPKFSTRFQDPGPPFAGTDALLQGANCQGKLRGGTERRQTPTGSWLLAKGFNLSYHRKETMSFAIDPDYGNLN